MSQDKPTVGRIVYYWPGKVEAEQGWALSKGKPLAAVVCGITHNGDLILNVMDFVGISRSRIGVKFVTSLDNLQSDDTAEGYATWMPYQIEQMKAKADKNMSVGSHNIADATIRQHVLNLAASAAMSDSGPAETIARAQSYMDWILGKE